MSATVATLLVITALHGTAVQPSPSPSPSPLRVETAQVEHDAVVRGLELRVGSRWQAWTIEVQDGSTAGTVLVRLSDDSGRIQTRELALSAETAQTRSRELSSALALLIDQLDPLDADPAAADPNAAQAPAPAPTLPPAAPTTSGWIGLGPRAALNPTSDLDPDVGVSLAGGAWLLRSHLQPVAELSWSAWSEDTLRVDAVRFGVGMLGGAAALGGRLWGGGGAVMRAQWARASASSTAAGWWASPAVVGALQYRGRIVVAGVWLGLDLLLPPLLARDEAHQLRWSSVRPTGTVHVGIRLPPGRGPRR
ncbi:MAG: hypothetical protein AB1Z98_18125 [Nannocystaceae bacterium]